MDLSLHAGCRESRAVSSTIRCGIKRDRGARVLENRSDTRRLTSRKLDLLARDSVKIKSLRLRVLRARAIILPCIDSSALRSGLGVREAYTDAASTRMPLSRYPEIMRAGGVLVVMRIPRRKISEIF